MSVGTVDIPEWMGRPVRVTDTLSKTPQPDDRTALLLAERYPAYGDPREFAARLGAVWGALLGIGPIEPRRVDLMMAALKVCREWHAHGQDNVDDAVAYLTLAGRLAE